MRVTWSAAHKKCQTLGATLATVPGHIQQGGNTHKHTFILYDIASV